MAREFSRTDRVSQQVHKEVAALLQNELKHQEPRLGMVTVSGAEVSRDLAYAKIFVTFFEDDKAVIKQQLKLLEDSAKFVRSLLARRIRMRAVPELRFMQDNSITEGVRISNLVTETRHSDAERARKVGRELDNDTENEE